MTTAIRRGAPLALVALLSAWLASRATSLGDWSSDSWPAVDALSHGRVGDYLSAEAMMGPFATLVQAPFAALGGGEMAAAYKWAAFPCLLATGILGLYLGSIAARAGGPRWAPWALGALCLVNPLTFEALERGHPEELLTAALAVGAVASAADGHGRRATLLLGLALATKQWAVIAILPTLMALPGNRLRAAAGAAAIAAVLVLPGILAAPGAFSEVQGNAASTGDRVTPYSVWYPLATEKAVAYEVGSNELRDTVSEAPALVGALSHPLIVALALALPLALIARRGRVGLSGADAMGLLALLALSRCALDPVDNLYYHVPLLLALLGWDAFGSRGLPLRGLAGTAAALLLWRWSQDLADVQAFNLAYIALVSAAAIAMFLALFRPAPGEKPNFREMKSEFRGSSPGASGRLVLCDESASASVPKANSL
jgi:Glycosyltransferase family 87